MNRIEAQRELFGGGWDAGLVITGFASAGIVAIVGLALGLRSMKRSSWVTDRITVPVGAVLALAVFQWSARSSPRAPV